MTRTQKQALASHLLAQAGDLVEFYEEKCPDLAAAGVAPEEVARQLAVWLQRLPGDNWNAALPHPADLYDHA